jgi:uncharacterized lipoprotein YmbA
MKAITIFFNETRTDYLVVGPLKTDAECEAEIQRLKAVYADKVITSIDWVSLHASGTVK